MKKSITIPVWLILFIIAILVISVYLYTRNHYKTDAKINTAIEQRDTIQREIKTATDKRDNTLTEISKSSQSKSDQATKIIKNLPNEKTVIRDTTYAAMCEYLTNYPSPVNIKP